MTPRKAQTSFPTAAPDGIQRDPTDRRPRAALSVTTQPAPPAAPMPSAFRSWTTPDAALSKIDEQIESDLGTEDATGALPRPNFVTYAGAASGQPRAGSSGSHAYGINHRLIEKRDHWQGGTLWPVAYPTADIRDRQLAKVRPMFTSMDTINKAVERQGNALLGREAVIEIVPLQPVPEPAEDASEEEKRLAVARKAVQEEEIALARGKFSAWWDSVQLWHHVKLAHQRAAWACRGPMRVRLLAQAMRRNGRTGETELVNGLTFEKALANVALSSPLPNAALVYVDPDTHEQACIIAFTEDTQRCAEVWFTEGTAVIRRILRPGAEQPQDLELPAGALPLREVRGNLLLTPSVVEQVAQLNYVKTKVGRVVQTACDRQMFATDIEPPGEYSLTPTPPGLPVKTAEDAAGNTLYFHPGSLDVGPELLVLANGRVVDGGEAGEEVLTPQIVVVDPVDPKYVTDVVDSTEAALLRGCSQGHTVTLDKATSGEEKRQDRADFGKQVESYRLSTELAVAGILTAAGKNALLMTDPSDPMFGFFDHYRISVTLFIDTGPLSAEEIRMDVELAEKGIKPRASVMASAGGVEDFEAAEKAIKADPIQRTLRLKDALDVAERISNVFTREAAVEYLRGTGLADESLLAALARSDVAGGGQ